jgi:hypothetical protein
LEKAATMRTRRTRKAALMHWDFGTPPRRRAQAVRRSAAERNRSVELHVPLATESSVTDSHLHWGGRQALSGDGLAKRWPRGPTWTARTLCRPRSAFARCGRASRARQRAPSGAEAAMRNRSRATFSAQHHDLQGHGSAAVSQAACRIAATRRQRTKCSVERRRGQRRLPLTPCMTGGEPGTRTPDWRLRPSANRFPRPPYPGIARRSRRPRPSGPRSPRKSPHASLGLAEALRRRRVFLSRHRRAGADAEAGFAEQRFGHSVGRSVQ